MIQLLGLVMARDRTVRDPDRNFSGSRLGIFRESRTNVPNEKCSDFSGFFRESRTKVPNKKFSDFSGFFGIEKGHFRTFFVKI